MLQGWETPVCSMRERAITPALPRRTALPKNAEPRLKSISSTQYGVFASSAEKEYFSQLSSFYKIPADRIIIMYDDISLPVGGLRVRTHGSHGGHNGMRDITEVMGTEKIMRVRIGVGQKPRPDYDLADWVLGRLPEEQLGDFNKAVEKAGEAVEEIICRGAERAMNKYTRL